MNVLCAVKAGGTARANAICSESRDCRVGESLRGGKVVEIVGGEVGDGSTG